MKRLLVCHYKDFFAGSIHDFELISSSSDINDAKEKIRKRKVCEKSWQGKEDVEIVRNFRKKEIHTKHIV